MTWIPPEEYVKTIANATGYAGLYFTDTAGRPVQLRAVRPEDTWQWPGGNMDPGDFARLKATDDARRTGTVAYLER
ncbi:hypothetical protein AB0F11_36975 [Streptomyces sp. NPDC032472]|uniref:hypothetical protein n=1 Tax=Streptomyces sp. NPDC032472 TaxID=3155018 RepID=UPI0033DFF08D